MTLRTWNLVEMSETGAPWPSIERHGLLSTRALLDLFEIEDPRRSRIVTQRGRASETLDHPVHGQAVVRDQIPLRVEPLRRCLTDMTLEQWLLALNSRVFFWLDEPHLETLLGANAYCEDAHDVLHVDTAALVARHAGEITLSPINSGSTIYNARPRGSQTFLPIRDYPFAERRRKRGRNAIIELAVDDGVRDITEVVVRVERRRSGAIVEAVLWER